MKKYLLFLFLFSSLFGFSQSKTESYILKYSSIAVVEMNIYNIPASITLAQGILESGNGESRLAVDGKNHFGIKCHSNWNGKTIIVDDKMIRFIVKILFVFELNEMALIFGWHLMNETVI